MKKNTKKYAQIRHAKRRSKNRFDYKLNNEEYLEIIKHIQNGDCEFIKKQSNSIDHFAIILPNGDNAIAIYHKKQEIIITFMYPEEDERCIWWKNLK